MAYDSLMHLKKCSPCKHNQKFLFPPNIFQVAATGIASDIINRILHWASLDKLTKSTYRRKKNREVK